MEEERSIRVMPNSLEAEQSVVGSMIIDKDAIIVAMDILTRDDFYHQNYGVLFEAIVEIYSAGSPVDTVTIQNKLKEKDVSPEVSSIDYLADLVAAVPTTVNVKSYANIVKDKALLRNIIRTNQEIEADCYSGNDTVEAILETTEKKIFNLVQSKGASDSTPISEIVYNALAKIQEASKQRGNVTGVPTGFLDLDTQTAGLQPSDLILVAARPSMGKTAFVLNIAQHIAFHDHRCAAIFSLEMSKEQLVNRLFSLESHVDAQKLRTGSLQDHEWEELIAGASNIAESNLIIDDTPGIDRKSVV